MTHRSITRALPFGLPVVHTAVHTPRTRIDASTQVFPNLRVSVVNNNNNMHLEVIQCDTGAGGRIVRVTTVPARHQNGDRDQADSAMSEGEGAVVHGVAWSTPTGNSTQGNSGTNVPYTFPFQDRESSLLWGGADQSID